MITEKRVTEKEYRKIELDSSSSIKVFAENRMKYYKRFVLHEDVEEEEDENRSILIGNIVDCLLLSSAEEFDSKFFMSICDSPPTGLMLEFVHNLTKHTKLNTTEDGIVTCDFSTICKAAYSDTPFKRDKFDTVISKFNGSNAETYYKEKRDSHGKQVVCMSDMDNANRIVEELRTNEFTRGIVNKINDGDGEVYKQLQLTDFEIDGVTLKSMKDLVHVNTRNKTIQVVDLKCSWSVENFYNEYYLKRKAYIQAYIYWKALDIKKEELGFKDYTTLPPQFLVCDSIGYYQPLIYQLTEDDLRDAYWGFYERGWYYKGVKEILEDLKWAKQENTWRISRINFQSNGISLLKRQ